MNKTPSEANMEEETSKLLNDPQPQHCAVDMLDTTVDTGKQNRTNSSKSVSNRTPTKETFAEDEEEKTLITNTRNITSLEQTEQTCIMLLDTQEDEDILSQPTVPFLQTVSGKTETSFNDAKTITPKPSNPAGTSWKKSDTVTVEIGQTSTKETETDDAADDTSNRGRSVVCLLGQERQSVTGRENQLVAISPVFAASLADRWQTTKTDSTTLVVEFPKVDVDSLMVILRFSQGEPLELTEKNVWHVLKTADMYHVSQVVDQCFSFLLHGHSRRHRSRHICTVLELAHELHYIPHYEACMNLLLQNVSKVFRNASALSELCQKCMLRLIKSEDIATVPEICIHDAMVTWAYRACAKGCGEAAPPNLEALRKVAGELVYHVRYLAIAPRTLKTLASRGGEISCLLTETELNNLLSGDVRNFPETVKTKRQIESKHIPALFRCCRNLKKQNGVMSVLFLIALFLIFLFATLFVPIQFALGSSGSE